MEIGFIGLGKLGMPCAEKFAEHFKVNGYDIEDRSVFCKRVSWQESIEKVVSMSDVIFVAVQTPHDENYGGATPSSGLEPRDFDYSHVLGVLGEIEKSDVRKKTIVLISTVLPGTMRNVVAKNFSQPQNIVYNPFLIAMGTEVYDLCNPEMVILGNHRGEECSSVTRIKKIYSKVIKPGSRTVLGTWEEAESVKIFYNTFISTKISLVNMIQDVSQKIGFMNSDVVAQALAYSDKRIISNAYMKPGMGDGGPCHPRDNIALRFLAEQTELGYDLFASIMAAREKQAENLADFIQRQGSNVCILGKAFKPGVTIETGSYGMLVGHYLESKGCHVCYDQHNAESRIFLLAHRGEFYDYAFPVGAIVVDPWREMPNREGIKVLHYGNTRPEGGPRPAATS